MFGDWGRAVDEGATEAVAILGHSYELEVLKSGDFVAGIGFWVLLGIHIISSS